MPYGGKFLLQVRLGRAVGANGNFLGFTLDAVPVRETF